LRTEILFNARVSPFDRPKDLTRRQLGALARNTLALTRQAYATSGVTNTAGRVKRMQAKGVSRRRYRHLAFDRSNESCYHCNDTIERIEVGGRRIYLCQSCQPSLRGAAAKELL
jgi:endonuclease-8